MTETTVVSQRDILDNRVFGFFNNALSWFSNHKIATILILIAIVILVFLVLKKGKIEKIGPIEFNLSQWNKKEKKVSKNNRRITDLPAPSPTIPENQLPSEFDILISDLKSGQRKQIQILCDNQRYAADIGALFYAKLEAEKVGDYIGWMLYKDFGNGQKLMDDCMDRDFKIYNDIENESIRKSKRLDFFDNPKRHIILFINLEEYDRKKDSSLERYNNFKGLSVILMSSERISGYKEYFVTENRGEQLCESNK